MNKTILSILILAAATIGAVISYCFIIDTYPTFGEFYNLLYLGLTLFFFGICVFISGLIFGSSLRENRS